MMKCTKILYCKCVITEVTATINQWNDDGYAWPDDWTRWQRAYYDAHAEAARAGLTVPPVDMWLF